MSKLTNETQEEELEPSEPVEAAPLQAVEIRPSRKQKGFWIWLGTFLKALCARKKQVSAQRKKSAQAWRDEAQSRNPFWGGGF